LNVAAAVILCTSKCTAASNASTASIASHRKPHCQQNTISNFAFINTFPFPNEKKIKKERKKEREKERIGE
jgi:hypothetical protein